MSVRLKAIELADLLGVAQASVSGAAINDHLCGGYPVAEWADKNPRGRILGYDVPDEVFGELTADDSDNKSNGGLTKEEQLEKFGEVMGLQDDLNKMGVEDGGIGRFDSLTKEEQLESTLKELGITKDQAGKMTLLEYFRDKLDAS